MASPFDQLRVLLGSAAPLPVELTQDEQDGVNALAQQVREAYAENKPVPSASQAVSLQVIVQVAQPELSLFELTRMVQKDPALAAAVLKVANSAAYSAGDEVSSLRDAVTRMGGAEVGRVAGMVAARTLFQPQLKQELAVFGSRFTACFEDAQLTAQLGARLAITGKGMKSDQVYLAGMLHDVGRAMALRCLAALTRGRGHLPDPLIDAVIDQVHVELGGQTHQNWDLPRFLTLVAMRHHDENLPTDGEFLAVHAVRLTSAMVQARHHPWVSTATREEINSSARALDLDAFGLRSLHTQLQEALGQKKGRGAPSRQTGVSPGSSCL